MRTWETIIRRPADKRSAQAAAAEGARNLIGDIEEKLTIIRVTSRNCSIPVHRDILLAYVRRERSGAERVHITTNPGEGCARSYVDREGVRGV